MMYAELVADFAKRTRVNLDAIRELRGAGQDVYEVTALINSMLGLLVFPQQNYVNSIPETPLADLRAAGWPLPRTRGGFPEVQSLRGLIRYLRNAITHCNLEFQSGGNGEISGLVVWNMDRGKRTWEAELDIEDLDGIAARFSEMLIDPRTWRPDGNA